MATEAKFPHITVRLDEEDGDAYAVLGRVMKALRNGGVSIADVDKYLFEATNGDYAHLLRTTMQWVSVIDGSGNRVSHAVTLPPPRRRLLRSRKIIPALLLAMTLGGCSEASAQSQPCKTIADDKERLACYDKAASGEQSAVEKNTAQIEKSSNARAAYADQVRKWFLTNGVSGMSISSLEKESANDLFKEIFHKQRHLYPR